MRKLFILLAFTCAPLVTKADYLRTNCQPDTLNPIPNTCTCDIKDSSNSSLSGFTQIACDQLACEEFESNQQPNECVQGMRGVTCFVGQLQGDLHCPLMMPRVDASLATPDVCVLAVDDINNYGPASKFYNFLDYSLCSYNNESQPRYNGWYFTGSFVDGWD